MRSRNLALGLAAAIVAAGMRNAADRSGAGGAEASREVRQADQRRPTSRRGTSTSAPPTARACRPAAGPWPRARRSTTRKCVACHGADAKGGPVYGTMVGGIGSFKTNTRVLTPGSMYPYAPILFDYIRRAMPMDKPQTLTPNEVYAVSAYILNLNGLIPADAVMDQNTLAQSADAEPQRLHRRRPAGHQGGALHDELQVTRSARRIGPDARPGGQTRCRTRFTASLASLCPRRDCREQRQVARTSPCTRHRARPNQEDAT